MKILKYSEGFQNVTQNTKRVYAIGGKMLLIDLFNAGLPLPSIWEEKWIICKAQKGDMQKMKHLCI